MLMFCNSNNEFVFCFLKKRRPHLRITEGKKGLCYISAVQICVNLGEGSACVCARVRVITVTVPSTAVPGWGEE